MDCDRHCCIKLQDIHEGQVNHGYQLPVQFLAYQTDIIHFYIGVYLQFTTYQQSDRDK